ncbi:MAG TPA: trypsin-like peptidase domain-containing protein [Candidatus Sulfotelmatobacter sp.]|nr:trypsin-like peptidase domain-containing protein [Candidatus Sulfotelmatobacter sp.]
MPHSFHATPRLVTVALLACFLTALTPATNPPSRPTPEDSDVSFAICPIVYPLDQEPSERGFHYLFYGNGFFINRDGYLLTAAHVLSQLGDVQPYIVLRLPMAPPRMLQADVVAVDREHDVALLRATPNPFEGKYQVRFLRLAIGRPALTQAVLAAALRPSRLKDPHSWDAFNEDRPSGEVIDYEFSQLDKGAADTRLLLFNHGVLLGDSGAPVVLPGSQAAVGLVEGRWLRPDAASLAAATDQPNSGVGAAILIHYAIDLLQRNGVSWHSLEEQNPVAAAGANADPTDPLPLSLISATHPPLALEGGEVVLDARVDPTGQLADIKTVAGPTAFVDKVLSAVHTWSFVPSPSQDHAKETRIGIVFQFASPGVLPNQSPIRHYQMPSGDTSPRAALPVLAVEPQLFAKSHSQPTLILAARISGAGELTSVQTVEDSDQLASTVVPILHQWQFAPAVCAEGKCDSTVLIVIVPRYGVTPVHMQSDPRSHVLSQ